MNSPVPCLRDPIQNMKNKNKTKNLKKGQKRQLRRPGNALVPYVQPGVYSAGGQTVAIPTAFGGKSGSRSMFPLSKGIGGTMRVMNFEQVISLTGSNGSFSAGGNVINPGLVNSFPWLSTIASNYQSFKIHYLRYIYVPACPTTTQGTAFLYLDYNFNSAVPTTLAQVDLSSNSCSGPAWLGSPIDSSVAFARDLQVSRCIHVDVDVRKLTQPWYNVRTSNNANLSTGGSISAGAQTFTPGSVPDTSGRPGIIYYGSNTNITPAANGLIYAAYDVEFFDPVASALNS
jgi:hypothetical protein